MKKDKQDKEIIREIRSVLLGKTHVTEDGRLTAKESGTILIPQGVVDGAGAVRFFGIRKTDCPFVSDLEEDALLEAATEGMRNLGRAVYLREQPEATACLIRYALTGPAVLCFRFADGRPLLTAWAARSPMGWITRRRAVDAFARKTEKSMRPVQEEDTGRKPWRNGAAPADPAPEDDGEASEECEEAPEDYEEESAYCEEGPWDDAPQAPDGDPEEEKTVMEQEDTET